MQLRFATGIGFEERQNPAIRCPGRTFDQPARGQLTLSRAIRAHHTDIELPLIHAGEGNEVTPRRPDRSGIAPLALADALDPRAIGTHHVKLLFPTAVGIEYNAISVRRIAR